MIREGVLEIYLRDRSYVYPLLKLLHSYLFYKVNKTDEYYKNKNIIRLENSIKGEKFIFVRQKGMYRNLLDFYLGKVDCTAAHVFRDDFIRLTKKNISYQINSSGIEVLLLTCNSQSRYYKDMELRKSVYSNLNKNLVLKFKNNFPSMIIFSVLMCLMIERFDWGMYASIGAVVVVNIVLAMFVLCIKREK